MLGCPHGALLCESSAQQGITSDSSDSRTSRIGSYTSKIGIHDELQYQGNVYIGDFLGVDVSRKP
jgi:hypothetical protein